MQIAVLGVNHKVACVSLREEIAKALLYRFSYADPLSSIDAQSVILSTCNRSELYIFSENLAEAHQKVLSIFREEVEFDFDQKCYSFFGVDCLQHLARVASGLDSACVAETEIQGQVRTAYEQACSLKTLHSELHFLFQKALKISKEVRTRFLFQKEIPNIEHAFTAKLKTHFRDATPPILFVGASEINIKIAKHLIQKGVSEITFTNRSQAALSKLQESIPCKTINWSLFQEAWSDFDCIVTATKSPHYLLTEELYATSPRQRLLIDLAVPRNIDPAIDAAIINIDSLQEFLNERRLTLQTAVTSAESLIKEAAERLVMARRRPLRLSLASL